MKRIIIDEEDKDMRSLIVKEMEKEGYKVKKFENGEREYERIKEEKFQILMKDIVMKEMDGIEMERSEKEIDKDIKIMLIKGFEEVEMKKDQEEKRDEKVI